MTAINTLYPSPDRLAKSRVLVCITEQKTCKRLLDAALSLPKEAAGEREIFVIHAATQEGKVIGDLKSAEILTYLFDQAKAVGASVTVVKSDDIRRTLLDFIVSETITDVVMGQTRLADEKKSVIARLRQDLSQTFVKIHVVPLGTGVDSLPAAD